MNLNKQELRDLIIPRGADIKQSITDFILANGWQYVYISGAVGSVIDMVFTVPSRNYLPLRCKKIALPDAAEMVSMSGEVMPIEEMDPDLEDIYPDKDSPLFVHIHASCAAADGRVIGGGLSSGKAFRALRVFFFPLG